MAPGWTVLAPALALLAAGPLRPAGSSGEGRWTCARGRARAWTSSVTTARSTLRARRQGGWASSAIERVRGWPWVLQEQSRQVAAGSFAS